MFGAIDLEGGARRYSSLVGQDTVYISAGEANQRADGSGGDNCLVQDLHWGSARQQRVVWELACQPRIVRAPSLRSLHKLMWHRRSLYTGVYLTTGGPVIRCVALNAASSTLRQASCS